MAYIGMRYSVFAPIASEAAENNPTYGTPVILDKPISASVSFTRSENPLYAGDVVAETDNSITGGTISLNLEDLTAEHKTAMLGVLADAGSEYYEETDAPGAAGGYGYIRPLKKAGVVAYEAYWVYKVQFSQAEDSAQTKAESVEWQTPTIEGTIMGIYNDTSGTAKFRRFNRFETYAEAKAFIDTLAGVAETPEETPEEPPEGTP